MGIGDTIMSTADARYYYNLFGIPCVFGRNGEKPFYDPEIYENNHKILNRTPEDREKVVVIGNYPGCRPYIKQVTKERYVWNDEFTVNKLGPGELYLTNQELEMGKRARGKIIIAPTVKDFVYSRNKAWPHWKAFVDIAKDLPLVQLSGGVPGLVESIETQSFRRALRCIANADMVITTDGALHHAAAALNVPCVTIWGGFISPEILGYDSQINVWHGHEPCGSLTECPHCKQAMASISPEEVLDAVLTFRSEIMDQASQNAPA